MKIMSKMGISTLRSYRSAKIFEAVGLGPNLMRDYFPGVVSPVGGLELEDLEKVLTGFTRLTGLEKPENHVNPVNPVKLLKSSCERRVTPLWLSIESV